MVEHETLFVRLFTLPGKGVLTIVLRPALPTPLPEWAGGKRGRRGDTNNRHSIQHLPCDEGRRGRPCLQESQGSLQVRGRGPSPLLRPTKGPRVERKYREVGPAATGMRGSRWRSWLVCSTGPKRTATDGSLISAVNDLFEGSVVAITGETYVADAAGGDS